MTPREIVFLCELASVRPIAIDSRGSVHFLNCVGIHIYICHNRPTRVLKKALFLSSREMIVVTVAMNAQWKKKGTSIIRHSSQKWCRNARMWKWWAPKIKKNPARMWELYVQKKQNAIGTWKSESMSERCHCRRRHSAPRKPPSIHYSHHQKKGSQATPACDHRHRKVASFPALASLGNAFLYTQNNNAPMYVHCATWQFLVNKCSSQRQRQIVVSRSSNASVGARRVSNEERKSIMVIKQVEITTTSLPSLFQQWHIGCQLWRLLHCIRTYSVWTLEAMRGNFFQTFCCRRSVGLCSSKVRQSEVSGLQQQVL